MQEIRLEKFKKEDAVFIKENFPNYFRDNSIENIERILEAWQDALCFCITYGGQKVGIISLGEKEEGKLSWGVMIKQEHRGKGIAQTAFNLIKKQAKERGYKKIISSCAKDNMASKNLHKKVGFKLIKEEINAAGNEMCRWEMEI